MKELKNKTIILLKGIFMGVADVIPGISGGTIAFITEIYDRLINNIGRVRDLGLQLIILIIEIFNATKRKEKYSTIKEKFNTIEFGFLIPLVIGILTALFFGSMIIPVAMTKYPSYVYSFFIGLILSSAVYIYKKIQSHKTIEILFGVIGLAIGILVSIAPAINNSGQPGIIYSTILGMIAITAMILPGISGSYILLIFGQYEFFLNAIHDIGNYYTQIIGLGIGAVIGLILFSKILEYLLTKHHSKTFYLLAGLMVGALLKPGIIATNSQTGITTWTISLILVVIGYVLVQYIEKKANKKKE